MDKIMIVEGLTDKKEIKKILMEHVTIICTHGTLGIEELDEMIETYDLDHRDVYIFVDQDDSGEMIRKQLQHELPNAKHLYVSGQYREVATTPAHILATELLSKGFKVNPFFLL